MLKKFLALSLILASSNHMAYSLELFQTGNPSAMFSGVTEGDMTFAQLKDKGNFGLGTFNGIQGEMVAVDGHFYQIGKQGKTVLAQPDWKTPWAQLVTFSPESSINLNKIANISELKSIIDSKLTNRNIPYAIQIKGQFNYLKLRTKTPRKALQMKNIHEDIYNLNAVSGTLVGFWFPEYLLNLALPGYHFHFISDDKKLSGHVLDLNADKLNVAFAEVDTINLKFPHTEVYKKAKIIAPSMDTYHQSQM